MKKPKKRSLIKTAYAHTVYPYILPHAKRGLQKLANKLPASMGGVGTVAGREALKKVRKKNRAK